MTQHGIEFETEAEAGAARLAELFDGAVVAVLTGAGMSTDSGIPDYRGDGMKPRRQPMTIAQFLESADHRRRYWAGSSTGWSRMVSAEPNEAHRALAVLEDQGLVSGVATQNVDGLHRAAGSRNVIELHGHLRTASCVACGRWEDRARLEARIHRDNPWLPTEIEDVFINPDGDAEVHRLDEFVPPACAFCGGPLKPDVVFFGELTRPETARAAERLVDEADAVLVAGSSLVVNTGRRFVHRARRQGKPIAIVNRTETAADHEVGLVVRAGLTETLTALERRLRLR